MKYVYSIPKEKESLILPSWPFAVSGHDKDARFKDGYRQALNDVLKFNGIDEINYTIETEKVYEFPTRKEPTSSKNG